MKLGLGTKATPQTHPISAQKLCKHTLPISFPVDSVFTCHRIEWVHGPSPWTRSSFSTLKIATFLKKICKLLQPWNPLHFLTSNFFSKLGCAQQSIFPGTLTFNVSGLSPSSSFRGSSSGGQT